MADGVFKKKNLSPFRSCEEELYGMAVLLAERYKLPLWDICMAHLEYLFSDSGYVFLDRTRRVDRIILATAL